MRKIILSTLSIALIAGGMTSCGKSSSGKMSNEWAVDSYEVKEVETDQNGDVTTTTTTFTGTTMTQTESSSGSSTTTATGIVSQADYTIDKDGTWNSVMEFSTSTTVLGVAYAVTKTQTNSGTWSFIGKNKGDDFKKNERVIFNTLESKTVDKTTTTSNGNSTTNTTTETDTYLTGDNSAIYTVTESKKDALKLTSDSKNTNTSSGSTTTTTSNAVTTTISLKAK